MVKSMTGYGSILEDHPDYQLQAEVKSLNSKSFDCRLTLPDELNARETELRNLAANHMKRGKISINLKIEYRNPELQQKKINRELFRSYFTDLQNVAHELNISPNEVFPVVARFRDIYDEPQFRLSEEHWDTVLHIVKKALEECNLHRETEGNELKKALISYAEKLTALKTEIDSLKKERLDTIRAKLLENIRELVNGDNEYSEKRLEQELIFYAEKLDIEEELVRLDSHLKYFLETLENEVCGRRLQFICQELNREINTIGSKANESRIQHRVVRMKEILEQIREQALNVL